MNKINCQNLTTVVSDLSVLKQSLDSGLSNFDAKASAEAGNAAKEKMSPYCLVGRVGGPEELRKRLNSVEIGWKSKEKLTEEVIAISSRNIDATDYILNSPGSQIIETPQKIDLIKLSLRELGLGVSSRMPEIRQQMAKLGLSMCPPETMFYLCLEDNSDISFCRAGNPILAMKPVSGYEWKNVVARAEIQEYSDLLKIALIPGDDERNWVDDDKFIFRIADHGPLKSLLSKK
jgi:hypothetical protein